MMVLFGRVLRKVLWSGIVVLRGMILWYFIVAGFVWYGMVLWVVWYGMVLWVV